MPIVVEKPNNEDCVCIIGFYDNYKNPREVYLVAEDNTFNNLKGIQGLFMPFNFCPYCGKELENADIN